MHTFRLIYKGIYRKKERERKLVCLPLSPSLSLYISYI